MRSPSSSKTIAAGRASAAAVAAIALACFLTVATPARAEGSGEHPGAGTITVSGTGSVTASPDMAVVRLGVETRGGNVARALDDAAARTAAIAKALAGDGVAARDITTVDYNLGFVPPPPSRSGAAPGGTAGGKSGYYRVSDVAAVTVRKLSTLGRILDDALSAGANEIQGVRFRIADPSPLEHQAREMAFRDARAKAEQIASLAGEKLGPVVRVSEGSSPLPESGGVFRAAAMASPAVSPGTLEVRISLHVVYRIGR